MKQLFTITLILFTAFSVFATREIALSDKEEERLNNILRVIKCVVCDGQSVKDSDTKFAKSIKLTVEEMINKKKTDSEIYGFIRSKYGDEVLFDPPLVSYTSFLWITPFLLIFVGFMLVIYSLKKAYNMNKSSKG
jgi:cytochrome c-type biogenesis protein CcmH